MTAIHVRAATKPSNPSSLRWYCTRCRKSHFVHRNFTGIECYGVNCDRAVLPLLIEGKPRSTFTIAGDLFRHWGRGRVEEVRTGRLWLDSEWEDRLHRLRDMQRLVG
jgi:hypothetical protein